MSIANDYKKPIIENSMKRLVEDGNAIQTLIAKLDFQIGFDQLDEAYDTVNILGTMVRQMDSIAETICMIIDQNN